MEENANYQLKTSEKEGILEIIIKGELTESSLDTLHDEVIAVVKEKKAKALLCDIRGARGPQDISDAYFRVRSIPLEVLKLPAALVFESVDESYQTFYETTAANVGQSIRWFKDVEEARGWLKSRISETR